MEESFDMSGLSRDQVLCRTYREPQWLVVHEDGSDFTAELPPAIKALRTGKPVYGVIAGVYRPRKEDYVWIR